DDYLEVRPEAEGAIRQLVADGRLAIGPWYVLMDEFCVSGETMIRDLQLGMQKADALGGHMHVGYLPDMFGHVTQMPQLLRLPAAHHLAARGPRRGPDRRPADVDRRAAVRGARQPADGRPLEPRRRQAGGGPRRTGARAIGGTAQRAVPSRERVAAAPVGHG